MGIKQALWALGILHLMFGLYALWAPDAIARWVGFEPQGVGAVGELRAVYGGLMLAVGLAIIRGSRQGLAGRQWLFAVTLAYAGLFLGRIVGLVADGAAPQTLVSMAVEGALAGFLLYAAGQVGSGESGSRPRPSDRAEDVPRIPRADVGPGGPA